MKIRIEHLDYTILVKPIPKNKPSSNAKAWVQWVEDGLVEIYIDRPINRTRSSLLAHEIIHILQNISEDRGIHFAAEKEHFGYLMQYIHGKIMGLNWEQLINNKATR